MELLCNALDKYAKPYVKYQKPKVNGLLFLVIVKKTNGCDSQIWIFMIMKWIFTFHFRVDILFGLSCHPTVMDKVGT